MIKITYSVVNHPEKLHGKVDSKVVSRMIRIREKMEIFNCFFKDKFKNYKQYVCFLHRYGLSGFEPSEVFGKLEELENDKYLNI